MSSWQRFDLALILWNTLGASHSVVSWSRLFNPHLHEPEQMRVHLIWIVADENNYDPEMQRIDQV